MTLIRTLIKGSMSDFNFWISLSLSDSLSELANPWFGLSPKFRVQIKVYAQSFRSAKD